MQCQILLVIDKQIQLNLEGESGSLTEVTKGFFPGTPMCVCNFQHEDKPNFNLHFEFIKSVVPCILAMGKNLGAKGTQKERVGLNNFLLWHGKGVQFIREQTNI